MTVTMKTSDCVTLAESDCALSLCAVCLMCGRLCVACFSFLEGSLTYKWISVLEKHLCHDCKWGEDGFVPSACCSGDTEVCLFRNSYQAPPISAVNWLRQDFSSRSWTQVCSSYMSSAQRKILGFLNFHM